MHACAICILTCLLLARNRRCLLSRSHRLTPPPRVPCPQGRVYPQLADHASTFLAATLFHTSAIANGLEAFRAQAARFENTAMCGLTEQVGPDETQCEPSDIG